MALFFRVGFSMSPLAKSPRMEHTVVSIIMILLKCTNFFIFIYENVTNLLDSLCGFTQVGNMSLFFKSYYTDSNLTPLMNYNRYTRIEIPNSI